MKRVCIIAIILFSCLGLASVAISIEQNPLPVRSGKLPAKHKAAAPKMVRVAIARDAREIDLAIEGEYLFRDAESGKVLLRSARLAKAKVRLLDKGIFIGLNVYSTKKLIISPSSDASVIINNHIFRGDVFLLRTKDNRITVVNSINIEDYIKGVLYHEVSHNWPMEALKAQAVAARTYALYSINSAAKEFDVTNDIYSQVYGGKESERYRTGLAVDRTVGQILVYKGKVLPTYFHATCGGMTEDAGALWEIDLPPLKGVPCAFCKDSPHFNWKKNFRLKEVQEALNRKGYKIGLIKDIAIVDRNRSERINILKIIDRDEKELVIKGKDFRDVMGPNVLKSNNYEITMQGYFVDFNGKGWGHGVGMCQWGARGMAAQQFLYNQILNYYYPHAEIIDYHDLDKPAK